MHTFTIEDLSPSTPIRQASLFIAREAFKKAVDEAAAALRLPDVRPGKEVMLCSFSFVNVVNGTKLSHELETVVHMSHSLFYGGFYALFAEIFTSIIKKRFQ